MQFNYGLLKQLRKQSADSTERSQLLDVQIEYLFSIERAKTSLMQDELDPLYFPETQNAYIELS